MPHHSPTKHGYSSASEIQYPCIQGVQSQVQWEKTELIRSHSTCGNGKLKLFFVVVLANVCINSGARCSWKCHLSPNTSNIPTFSSSCSMVICHLAAVLVYTNGNIHHALKCTIMFPTIITNKKPDLTISGFHLLGMQHTVDPCKYVWQNVAFNLINVVNELWKRSKISYLFCLPAQRALSNWTTVHVSD